MTLHEFLLICRQGFDTRLRNNIPYSKRFFEIYWKWRLRRINFKYIAEQLSMDDFYPGSFREVLQRLSEL